MKHLTSPTGLILISTLLVCVLRFTVPGHNLSWAGTYEAIAHIWVGVMLVLVIQAWMMCRARGSHVFNDQEMPGVVAGLCLVAATALETVMFLTR